MRAIRPDLRLLWPSYTLFPLIGLGMLGVGAGVGDPVLVVIGLGLLAFNAILVLDHASFTTLTIDGDALVHRSRFGLQVQRVSIGQVQRIDAKRYPGAHGGVSAPYLVARGRDATLKVNSKPYRLAELAPLLTLVRQMNPRVQMDPFWEQVERGEDVSKDVAVTPTSRF